MRPRLLPCTLALGLAALALPALAAEPSGGRVYENRLTPITDPKPILADHPEFVQPIREEARFEAPVLVDEPGADLHVRAWRFCYNARGIIEVPTRLRADHTAVVVVHPWGIDDGRGWTTPQPAGVAFACTPTKNRICLDHMRQVINPFLKSLRGSVAVVLYSLPGKEDPIRKKVYRSIHGRPTDAERREGQKELAAKLKDFDYRGAALPARIKLGDGPEAAAYFRALPGLDASAKYDHAGFWEQPIPVAKPIEVAPDDVVLYDPQGYDALRDFLKKQGVRHVLLAGYHADMCVCKTTAGYKNLSQDFNVFLVGDATLATFPAADTPRYATNQTIAFAALDQFITQVSWVRKVGEQRTRR